MFFELHGKTYKVRFYRIDNMTFAELHLVKEDDIVFTGLDGVAVRNPKDREDRGKGRKVALADLLNNMTDVFSTIAGLEITKADREAIWSTYFETHRK